VHSTTKTTLSALWVCVWWGGGGFWVVTEKIITFGSK